MKTLKFLTLATLVATFMAGCNTPNQNPPDDAPPAVSNPCDLDFNDLDNENPVIFTVILSNGEIQAQFIVKNEMDGEPLFWGYNDPISPVNTVNIGVDKNQAALESKGYQHVQPLTLLNGSQRLFLQTVTLNDNHTFKTLNLQIYSDGGKKGKGTLVSSRPIVPNMVGPYVSDEDPNQPGPGPVGNE